MEFTFFFYSIVDIEFIYSPHAHIHAPMLEDLHFDMKIHRTIFNFFFFWEWVPFQFCIKKKKFRKIIWSSPKLLYLSSSFVSTSITVLDYFQIVTSIRSTVNPSLVIRKKSQKNRRNKRRKRKVRKYRSVNDNFSHFKPFCLSYCNSKNLKETLHSCLFFFFFFLFSLCWLVLFILSTVVILGMGICHGN